MNQLFKTLNIPGGVALGLWTLNMLVLSWVKDDIPSGVVTSYGLALGAFAAHSVSKVIKGAKNEAPPPTVP